MREVVSKSVTHDLEPREAANDRAGALAELRARVEAATADDRVLFAFVGEAFIDALDAASWARFLKFIDAEAWESAALALVERVLPGWRWRLFGPTKRADFGCDLTAGTDDDELFACANAPTPALALLSAMLKALEASHG